MISKTAVNIAMGSPLYFKMSPSDRKGVIKELTKALTEAAIPRPDVSYILPATASVAC